MFNAFYQLNEHPFTADISHKWLYLSTSHSEAIAHLNYGVEQTAGFILLTGEQGSGKSTLLNAFIKQLPESTDVAVIRNPAMSEIALLAKLCDELSLTFSEHTLKHLIDRLSEYLLNNHKDGRQTVMVIDDAQHLSEAVLEQLRLLTNLETDTTKLLQIILVGDTTLKQHLNQNSLRQIAQRITVRSHLVPLNLTGTQELIAHRLRISGRHEPLFKNTAIKLIFKYSDGNPRTINQICERAMMIGYGKSSMQIDASIARLAIKEALGVESNQMNDNFSYLAVASLTLVSVFAVVLFMLITPAKSLNITQEEHVTKPTIDSSLLAQPLQKTTQNTKQNTTQKIDQTSNINLAKLSNLNKLDELDELDEINQLDNKPTHSIQAAIPQEVAVKPVVIGGNQKEAKLVAKAVTSSKSKVSWYVVQLYAGKQQPTSLDRFTCGDNKPLVRHHTDTFYITSPNLTLADAKTFQKSINNQCQLDAWVKPLPKSWQT
ncbi:ExeA family protein [Shewanella sp. UCD-KL12]|uniref:ExeA family protein n=1 Tax=Shewanella sp. UCD-KL12 TaxID=1917163 RepID=UPI000970B605|nr:AAA family ATPase [Shewanella sp. UCD-KL12]